ncbi:MucR family transcriptional regulator [Sphingobium sp. TCM1]|uniref:MucR family transcriptional regulator n=1 Tax=Sphingobium sp. TCM1 TaxID=453246 RepID=UPI0007F3726C|nr:MucR family transcriptional regulator [Sphingobium sp. TCM1]OAN53491.1 MucR family transcriptional regulator [Sphingobium sp. TCM1]
MAEAEQSDVMSLTVALLSAYFANNTVPSSELPALVEGTRKALLGDTSTVSPAAEEAIPAPGPVAPAAVAPVSVEPVVEAPAPVPDFKPAVSIEESLASPDQILSMIDGKPYKALKRHLSTHGLTPAEYRARYDLPADYPLVAPGYSAARREVALKFGLGGKRKGAAAEPGAAEADNAAPAPDATPADVVAETTAPARKPRVKAPAPATRAKPKATTRKGKPDIVAEAEAPAGEPAPASEPVASDVAQEKAAPARKPRAKAAAAKVAPKTKAKAATGKAKPPAVVEAAKPKRSRAPKADTPPTAQVEAAPAEPAPAE